MDKKKIIILGTAGLGLFALDYLKAHYDVEFLTLQDSQVQPEVVELKDLEAILPKHLRYEFKRSVIPSERPKSFYQKYFQSRFVPNNYLAFKNSINKQGHYNNGYKGLKRS